MRRAGRTYAEAREEPDYDKRLALLQTAMTEDVVFVDGGYRAVGYAEVIELMDAFKAGGPPATSLPADAEANRPLPPVERPDPDKVDVSAQFEDWEMDLWAYQITNEFFFFHFAWTGPDGVTRGGTEFGECATDGRIRRLVVFPGL